MGQDTSWKSPERAITWMGLVSAILSPSCAILHPRKRMNFLESTEEGIWAFVDSRVQLVRASGPGTTATITDLRIKGPTSWVFFFFFSFCTQNAYSENVILAAQSDITSVYVSQGALGSSNRNQFWLLQRKRHLLIGCGWVERLREKNGKWTYNI